MGSRVCLLIGRRRSVQLRERSAHGGGGERGRVHGVHGGQPAGLRQQRRDHGTPQDARHPLLRLQHHGPLRRRDEARRDRRRLLLPRHADADDTKDVPDPHHALHDAGDPGHHALHDPDHHHALHDADDPDVRRRWRHHDNHPGHDAVHGVPQRGRPRAGGVGRLWPGLVCDRPASAALDTRGH
jgi:hypothetical protein